MHTLDEWFRLHHGLRKQGIRQRLLAGEIPVLIRVDDQLIMLHRKQRFCARILDDAYHGYKAVCHVPVALFLWASQLIGVEHDADTRQQFGRLRDELSRGIEQLELGDEGSDGDPEAATVRAILCAAEQLAAASLDHGQVERERLQQFEQGVRAPMERLIRAATRQELTRLHRTVACWTHGLASEDWARLRVVICANHQARYRQSTKQYFQRLLGEEESVGASGERRVVYAENCSTEDEAIDLLATHLLDREIGAFFLGSPLAMQQDLLGEAASEVLDSMFR